MKIKETVVVLAVCLILAPALLPAASPVTHYADMVLYNGKVGTVDKGFTIAQAVAIRDGKFLSVGESFKKVKRTFKRRECL
jgi:hypothetical protein